MLLELRRLAFGYPGKVVGRDLTLSLDAGEVLTLLGPNGSGKTTLFKTILRLLEPLGGAVVVDGEPTARWPRRRLAGVFGYVPQAQPGVFPFTVREMVLMGRTAHIGLFAAPARHDVETAERALDVLGIAHLGDRPYAGVSGGERQLALIARALAQEPRILVMDEPTASLDFGNQVRVLSEVQALAKAGIAVVLSSHDPDQAFLCAHRVALLDHGRLARVGPPDEVISAESLGAVYGVDVEVRRLEGPDGEALRVCIPSLRRARATATAVGHGGPTAR